MKQLIFVVETDSNNQSDDRYIKKLINSRYDLSSNEIKTQYVHMGGKSHYDDSAVTSRINKYVKGNKGGENHIIYCFDTDEIESQYKYKEEFISKIRLVVWYNNQPTNLII